MSRITTINDIEMIQCGDYNWRVLKENDGTEIFELTISVGDYEKSKGYSDITLYYDTKHKVFSIRKFESTYFGGDFFCFKLNFKNTPSLVKSLIDGHNGYLQPIFHKETVKIKQ